MNDSMKNYSGDEPENVMWAIIKFLCGLAFLGIAAIIISVLK
jgi:hypothetical protein